MEKKEMRHPAYGTLAFNRRTGGATELFGSSIKHQDTISMKLYHAHATRKYNTDWYSTDGVIAEVEMSYSQFAEAITSMNCGVGTPVTIRWTEKDGKIPGCEWNNKREQFVREFSEKRKVATEDLHKLISVVSDIFQKKTLNKADKDLVLKSLNRLDSQLGSNLDFVADMFNEQMDKTVLEAKGEIEAFCQNKINSIASASLIEHRDEIKKLENPVKM